MYVEYLLVAVFLCVCRNLSYDTEEDDLEEMMSEFGDVEYCRIVVDHATEHSRGERR